MTADSEQGFSSDYNDLYATGSGQLGLLGKPGFQQPWHDWVYDLGLDGHSHAADPQFIDPAGTDGVLGYSTTPVGAADIVETGDPGFSTTGSWSPLSGGLGGTVLVGSGDGAWPVGPSPA